MHKFFRNLTSQDIPKICQIAEKIWNDEDYIPRVIGKWLQDPKAEHIGIFSTQQMDNEALQGFMRIHWYSDNHAWLEGLRIDPDYQQQGLGRKLFEFCLNHALDQRATKLQYDTWATWDQMENRDIEQNHGSIALARRFGFNKKQYVDALEGNINELKVNRINTTIQRPNIDISINHYEKVSKKVIISELFNLIKNKFEDFNRGWSYFPCNQTNIDKQGSNITWWKNSAAMIQLVQHSDSPDVESPQKYSVWMICFGEGEKCVELLFSLIKSELNIEYLRTVEVFCSRTLTRFLIPVGFHYFSKEPSGVVLFERIV